MKLKRLLLRYEPPGVGLECQHDNGAIDVRHLDLPDKEMVHSAADIDRLVEDLMRTEPILSKKHKGALAQMLGRLYEKDIPEGPGSPKLSPRPINAQDSPSKGGAGAQDAQTPSSKWQKGQKVVLMKMKNLSINGQVGILKKAKPDKEKYEVELMNGEKVEIKGKGEEINKHLIRVNEVSSLAVGARVIIGSLRNHAEMNGCLGRVSEYNDELQRYEVRAEGGGQLFRVRPENLVCVEETDGSQKAFPDRQKGRAKENAEPNVNDSLTGRTPRGEPGEANLEPGSIVKLVHLKTAAWLNGEQAEIVSADRERQRYEIKLQMDGSVKKIRAENVELVHSPSEAPRRR
jgi:hypothetical protein